MPPHANYKYPFPESSVVGHHSSIRSDQAFATLPGHCDLDCWPLSLGVHLQMGQLPQCTLASLVASFLSVTGEVPAGLVAEPLWPQSAAGEPFLRAEIVTQPFSHYRGKIPFSLVMQCHPGYVFISGVQNLESW